MITQKCNRLTARKWFAHRGKLDVVVVAILFAPLFFFLRCLFDDLTAGGIDIAIIFCLYFFVLPERKIAIICHHCGGYVQTDRPWICGNRGCGHQNDRVDNHPFIGRCEKCGVEPDSYQCHHEDCGKTIFFTKDERALTRATSANSRPEPRREKRDEHIDDLAQRKKTIERKKLEAEEAEIDIKLKGARQNLEGPKVKSMTDRFREAAKDEIEEKELRAMIDREFKDNEEERKRQHLRLDQIKKEMPY